MYFKHRKPYKILQHRGL